MPFGSCFVAPGTGVLLNDEKSRKYGNMQAIHWHKKENKVYATSDPQGEGEAKVMEK